MTTYIITLLVSFESGCLEKTCTRIQFLCEGGKNKYLKTNCSVVMMSSYNFIRLSTFIFISCLSFITEIKQEKPLDTFPKPQLPSFSQISIKTENPKPATSNMQSFTQKLTNVPPLKNEANIFTSQKTGAAFAYACKYFSMLPPTKYIFVKS